MLNWRTAYDWRIDTIAAQNLRAVAMKHFLKWLTSKYSSRKDTLRRDLRQTGSFSNGKASRRKQSPAPQKHQQDVGAHPQVSGVTAEIGPHDKLQNREVLIRKTDETSDTLHLDDHSLIEIAEDSGDEAGIDPYNSGQFDRSKNWDKRFRK